MPGDGGREVLTGGWFWPRRRRRHYEHARGPRGGRGGRGGHLLQAVEGEGEVEAHGQQRERRHRTDRSEHNSKPTHCNTSGGKSSTLYVQVYFRAGEYRNFIALPTQGLATNEGNFLYLPNSSAGVVSLLRRRRRKVLDKVSKV